MQTSQSPLTVSPLPFGPFLWPHCPRSCPQLCARIVQEDLILIREVPEGPEHDQATVSAEAALKGVRGRNGNREEATPHKWSPNVRPHVMTAAAVVFSFAELEVRLPVSGPRIVNPNLGPARGGAQAQPVRSQQPGLGA